ncbi:MAG: hypothetical protein IJ824_01290 [Alphaproteobacteria bacterium]|nr:hypothetical protein [Alphaproteobacteria bacterium]
MKKIYLLTALIISVQLCFAGATKAEISDAEKLTEVLSAAHGAPVKADITDEKCQIVYPAVEIEEALLADEQDEKNASQAAEVIKTTIGETVADCAKVEDFDGKTQYKITNSAPNSVIAKFYNLSGLAFVKNLDIKTFNEEVFVVPELGLISADKLHIAGASYTEKDDTTGLKSELGNLKDLVSEQTITKEGDKIKYKTEAELDSLNIALPIVSVHIGSEKQVAELEYQQPTDRVFNYQDMLQNLEDLLLSKSHLVAHNIKFNMDMIGLGLTFDMNTQNHTEVKKDGFFDSVGSIIMDKMVFVGDMLEKSKQPQSVIMKYSLKGIQTKDIKLLTQIQKDKLENNKEPDDAELAKILDDLSETVTLITNIKVKFAQGNVTGKLAARKKNGYLQGGLKVLVTDLFTIFPEFQKCRNNPNAAQMQECAMMPIYEGMGDFIDITKNNSETIIKFNEHGVFKDGKKIGEPIELNFQKMQRESEIKQKENEEELNRFMQEQQKIEDQRISVQ